MILRLTTLLCLAAIAAVARSQSEPDLYDDTKLRTLELTFHQTDWWARLVANRPSETYIKADLGIDNVLLKDVGVRLRGGTSFRDGAATGKYPFRIGIDAFIADQRLWSRRSLVLNNGHYDPTFCREPLAYRVYRDLMPASRANFVRLSLNKQYWGLYVNVEPTNKDFLRQWYADEDGHRYKGEAQLSPLANFPLTHPLVSRPSADAYYDLRAVAIAAFSSNVVRDLPPVFDVHQALRYMAGANVVSDIDGLFRLNYYLYADPWHGRMSVLPWDLNWTFIQPLPALLNGYLTALSRPEWKPYIAAHARGAAATTFGWQELGPTVLRWHQMIDAAVQSDPRKLYSYADFQANLTRSVQIGFIEVPGLQPWIEERRKTLLTTVPAGPDLLEATRQPAAPGPKDQVTLTVRSRTADQVAVHWRSRGGWTETAMHDDGQHGDGQPADGVWGTRLPAQRAGARIDYWFEAAVAAQRGAGAIAFLPPGAGHRPLGYRVLPAWDGVILNELVARNARGITDEKGEREDWIELFNPTPSPVDLAGRFLTDDLRQPSKWQFPANTRIAALGTLLVWADDEPSDGPLHANFKIEGAGEELALVDSDGATVLDHVEFGVQAQDVATGRLFDRLAPWVTLPLPTPGAPNAPLVCGLRHYSALDPTWHLLTLTLGGSPRIGTAPPLRLGNGAANSAFLLLLAARGGHAPLPGTAISLLLDGPLLSIDVVPSGGNGDGALPLPIPSDQRLVGVRAYFQTLGVREGRLVAGNGLEVAICGS